MVVATRLEAWAAARLLPPDVIWRCGIGARRLPGIDQAPLLISCGLAAGLRPDVTPGAVLVPGAVAWLGGPHIPCDLEMLARLRDSAHRLGFEVVTDALVTVDRLVRGADRETWADQGYVGADMETARLMGGGRRVAAVRIILDTPLRELAVRNGLWLARWGPVYARRAAAVVSGSGLVDRR